MLIHPQFNPVALSIGPVSVHWYGLMYLAAFVQFWWLGKWRIEHGHAPGWKEEALDDMIFYGVLGVILGGRLGQVFFYEPAHYFSHPAEILKVWKGGMSFHGGMLGVFAAMLLVGRKHGRRWLEVTDFVAPLVPLGLAVGRLGNFINGELWGRPAEASLPWAMVFPHVDQIPRHPSQLYQMAGEGALLFILLWVFARKPRQTGAVSGMFMIGYGIFRFLAEFFRTPDMGIFGQSYIVSMGQWLSLPMLVVGLVLLYRARHRQEKV